MPPRPPEAPTSPGGRAAGPAPPAGSLLTGTVIIVHGEVVRPPLVRDVVARDLGDREHLLPWTHPVVLVQFELFFLYLGNETVSWWLLCLPHWPPSARGRPARPPPGSWAQGSGSSPATPPPPLRGPAVVLRGSREGLSSVAALGAHSQGGRETGSRRTCGNPPGWVFEPIRGHRMGVDESSLEGRPRGTEGTGHGRGLGGGARGTRPSSTTPANAKALAQSLPKRS